MYLKQHFIDFFSNKEEKFYSFIEDFLILRIKHSTGLERPNYGDLVDFNLDTQFSGKKS